MDKELYRYNPWWEGYTEALDKLHSRPLHDQQLLQQLQNKQVVLLTGLRRVGKTSLMKRCIRHLMADKQVSPENILYVSMDDYLLKDETILSITEHFRKMHKHSVKDQIYLFLDEITHVSDYDQQLKNLYDQGGVKIFASSSSASLLRSKQAYLTGRNITFEILPLDFDEYLQFKQIRLDKADGHLNDTYFRDYLICGGIPEYVLTGDDAYIRELMDNIIYKDIAAIHGIRQVQLLKDYFLLLMERSGKTMSINKVAKILGISNDTSRRFFDLFCDTFIVYPVTKYGKLNEQMVAPKKIYCCDTGIRNYYTGVRDWGAMFENYCFLRLKHLQLKYLNQDATELDFVTERKWLIECKYHEEELNEKQQLLFDSFQANEKYILRTYEDVKQLISPNK